MGFLHDIVSIASTVKDMKDEISQIKDDVLSSVQGATDEIKGVSDSIKSQVGLPVSTDVQETDSTN